METWKSIKDYEKLYRISNLGNVKSLARQMAFDDGRIYNFKDKILKPGLSKNGYLTVSLKKDKKGKTFYIHQLVTKHFIKNINEYKFINHKDENKLNNNVNNLEWCTQKYNNSYGTAKERTAKTQSKKVGRFLNSELLETYESMKITRMQGFYPEGVSSCCRGERKTHSGYTWKYL